jgi:nucleoside-diphosphate-sugar epimerase
MTDLSYSGVRVAVFGASGFIGRWVARALTRENANVLLVVRDRKSMERIADRYGIRGEIVELDLIDRRAAASFLEHTRPAITFNLAGYGVDPAERDERVMHEVNVELTSVLIDAVADRRDPDWNGQAVVHAGSALEYGATHGELSENSPTNPIEPYGTSKLAATRLLTHRAAELGVRAVTARLFTVYGPGEHSGRLLPSLVEAAKSGSSVSLTEGRQERDFCYVEDIAEGLLRLGVSHATAGETVNLASGKLTSVRDFTLTAARVMRIPEDRLAFGAKAVRDDEMWQGRVRTDRLRKLLDWAPSTEIDEGVRRTWEFESSPNATTPIEAVAPPTPKTIEHPDAA